ncbi:hypothetical protein Mx8p79 [Myxococcus phage Mx8]|uniref:p79 n=1 Tax=Myxococcus phage Mx8 TaxID=49964 RepID=Q94MP0_9CAUD|nr:hypothetical protein Mx8p79 [Myxococcus phage Mx8]AAK94414.1 p79 [Myxococcus phage Mx8]
MGTRRLNPKARRYLLAFKPEPFAYAHNTTGGRWALESYSLTERVNVRHFDTPQLRDAWVSQNPTQRLAVGKRDAYVKAYRARMRRAH